ncbi:MAG: DNRLRE domain-containing protein, partial [Armatimonadetes bacterium]|nr:DNRLRE domain-containing protein [Armatimonadota bacterium]
NGTTYYYQVVATNPRGQSDPTNLASTSPSKVITLFGEADAFVRGGADAATKFGLASNLNVSANETTYLRFDLDKFRGTGVISAKLQLFGQRNAAGISTYAVYVVADNNWTEAAITNNSAPTLGAKVVSATVPNSLNYVTWDISALVRKYRDNHTRFLNLAVKREGADAASDVFISREQALNPPLLSVGIADYPNYPTGFSNADDLVLNGGTATATPPGSPTTNLRLTDFAQSTSSSAFFNRPVDIQRFKTSFTYRPAKATAEGITLCIQGNDATALGKPGGGLGYQQIPRSVAFKIDLFNNVGEGDSSTGIFKNGAVPTVPSTNLLNSAINFHWGHTYQFDVTYNGWNFDVAIKDVDTGRFAKVRYTVNIPATIGSTAGYVGFTGSTGGLVARQDIVSWTMSAP